MLLWASKFATAKIECSFEMGKQTPLGPGNIYFAGDCAYAPKFLMAMQAALNTKGPFLDAEDNSSTWNI